MGDANGSIPTVQPVYMKPMWGSHAASAALNSVAFVSQVSISSGTIASYGIKKRAIAVENCRNIGKADMKWNNSTPQMHVDPESYEVHADGVLATVSVATSLPLGKLYNLF
jgi:urease